MIRSMMLVLAVAAGAAGCATDATADDSTAAVAQNTGLGFTCSNNTVDVLCQGTVLPVNINVKDVGVNVLDGNKISILENDLNDLNIGNINILNGNSVLSDLVDVTKNDFLNKFSVNVLTGKTCAVVSILGLGICK